MPFSFKSLSGGTLVQKTQAFNSTGSWTAPANVYSINAFSMVNGLDGSNDL